MIISYDTLADLRKQFHDVPIVLGGGSFDLIHYGHVQYLQALQEYGSLVVAGIKSDAEISSDKGIMRPVIPESDRLRLVDAIKGVDYVFMLPFGGERVAGSQIVETTLKVLRPDRFVTANNKWLYLKQSNLTEVIIRPRFTGGHFSSTTDILGHIRRDTMIQ